MFSIEFIFLPTTLHFFLNYLNLNYFLLVLYYHNSTFVILLQSSSLSLVSHDVYIYFLPTLVCEMYKSCEFDTFFLILSSPDLTFTLVTDISKVSMSFRQMRSERTNFDYALQTSSFLPQVFLLSQQQSTSGNLAHKHVQSRINIYCSTFDHCITVFESLTLISDYN